MSTFSERFAELPDELVAKVNAYKDEGLFTQVGNSVVATLEAEFGPLSAFGDVLDFGCGLGRVLRPLIDWAPGVRIVGFDIDLAMLEGCRRLMAEDRIRLVSSTGELAGGTFDLIFAISVFTHLDESFDYWLQEIDRLLRPGGRALLTYQDETLFGEMVAEGKIAPPLSGQAVLADRFVVGEGTIEGDAAMGTFLTTRHWEELVGKHFAIQATRPRGLFGHQSYSVLAKKASWREA